ncbi:hypothetical protein [Streptomyces sp. Isolate_45]|uniref:hypothetical protein n=1 Tax=Streptomyces sp. Isolate_45 TaxID=2950111 RepID=UPI002481E41A|nr:hypothetical protein [Streptomyces sp. Isolate_45]MDA5279595.1 hypothetical protein [Streptomyces sp. Isolate_45]
MVVDRPDHAPLDTADEEDETVDQKPADEGAKVISLNTRRLPSDARSALPDMSKYDRLLMPLRNTTTRKGTSA